MSTRTSSASSSRVGQRTSAAASCAPGCWPTCWRPHGFRVDIKNDSMFAVAEAYNAEETLRRTRLIGYLLIHSRQVDMIMKDTVRAAALKEKLAGDMATLMAKPLQFS